MCLQLADRRLPVVHDALDVEVSVGDAVKAGLQRVPRAGAVDGTIELVIGLGNVAKSDAALAELTASFSDSQAFQIAEVHAYRGNYSAAFDWLRRNRAYCATASNAPWLYECTGQDAQDSPFLAPLRADPRWNDLSTVG